MAVWFTSLAPLGIADGAQPRSPGRALAALRTAALLGAWLAGLRRHSGSVVLSVTGAEALYADMGHFGAPADPLAWFWFVLPSLVLNYFGQGALVLRDPAALENPSTCWRRTCCGCRWSSWPPWRP